MRTLIVGLGNPILGDDGAGWRASRLLAPILADDRSVDVVEAAVGGLRLMEMTVGYDRVVLIDAMVDPTAVAGEIRRLSLTELARTAPRRHTSSAHDTNLPTAMSLGRRLGLAIPEEWVIYAVVIEPVNTFGEKMSPAVARAVPELAAAVRRELDPVPAL